MWDCYYVICDCIGNTTMYWHFLELIRGIRHTAWRPQGTTCRGKDCEYCHHLLKGSKTHDEKKMFSKLVALRVNPDRLDTVFRASITLSVGILYTLLSWYSGGGVQYALTAIPFIFSLFVHTTSPLRYHTRWKHPRIGAHLDNVHYLPVYTL